MMTMNRQNNLPPSSKLTMRMMNEREQKLRNLRCIFNVLYVSGHPAAVKALAHFKEQVTAISGNTYYEHIQSISYNPQLQLLQAIVSAKRDPGYNESLCPGPYAFVRFYLNYGNGWQDQGYSAVNEQGISTAIGWAGIPENRVTFSASLRIFPKIDPCGVHVRPQVRAVLEWNKIPPANEPEYSPAWGNAVDDYIQVTPECGWLN